MPDMDSDPTSEAYQRLDFTPDSSGRHRFINRRTNVMLDLARKKMGFDIVVIQGSYMLPAEVADASEHTHDGGGVLDLRTHDIPAGIGTTRAVRALREVGFAAFHRTHPPFKEDHIHAVAIGDVEMDPSARNQVDQYINDELDGLGSNDTGPRVRPVVIFDYDRQGFDMQLDEKIPGTHKTVGEALLAAINAERAIESLSKRQAKRNQRLVKRSKRLTQQVTATAEAVNRLPEGATKQEVKTLLLGLGEDLQELVVTDDDNDDDS